MQYGARVGRLRPKFGSPLVKEEINGQKKVQNKRKLLYFPKRRFVLNSPKIKNGNNAGNNNPNKYGVFCGKRDSPLKKRWPKFKCAE